MVYQYDVDGGLWPECIGHQVGGCIYQLAGPAGAVTAPNSLRRLTMMTWLVAMFLLFAAYFLPGLLDNAPAVTSLLSGGG